MDADTDGPSLHRSLEASQHVEERFAQAMKHEAYMKYPKMYGKCWDIIYIYYNII